MKNFLIQTSLNYRRVILRNKSFFAFGLGLPVVFYLLFSKALLGTMVQMPAAYVATWQADYLVSMVVYSSCIASIISASTTLFDDRAHQFTLFVQLTGARHALSRYYAGMAAVFIPINGLSIAVLGLTGVLVNHVQLSVTAWLVFVLVLPVASVPLLLIGLLISCVSRANTVVVLGQLVTYAMAILSGLWMPIAMLPDGMRAVGHRLPAYEVSALVTTLIHDSSPGLSDVFLKGASLRGTLVGLLVWTVLLLAAAALCLRAQRHRESMLY